MLDTLLERFRELGLLKVRGKQRTDSTHVLAAIRTVDRLTLVGETLRHVLNELAGYGVLASHETEVPVDITLHEHLCLGFGESRGLRPERAGAGLRRL